MGTILQIGHHSKNLLDEESLFFDGAILSPVNYTKAECISIIEENDYKEIEIIFDPQLYFPNEARQNLVNWDYFPEDVDTVDLSNIQWWEKLNCQLISTMKEINPDSLCSPAVVPRIYSSKYYEICSIVTNDLIDEADSTNIDVIQTILIEIKSLKSQKYIENILPKLMVSKANRFYLIFVSEIEPRRELEDLGILLKCMILIKKIRNQGKDVIIGYSSSDQILWKYAGSNHCATGKFFNLRRFTPSRFVPPPTGGGGQISYWFEENIMAFLRDHDIQLLRLENLLSNHSLQNPYSIKIIDQIDKTPDEAWLGLSWRQYLYWFIEFEKNYRLGIIDPKTILKNAEKIWLQIEEKDILMDEPRNDGSWIRP